MSNYTVQIDNKMDLNRVGPDMMEIEIGGQKAKILTEDLASICKQMLPTDKANEYFAHIEEQKISKGKMRIKLEAQCDIKKGDYIVSSIDVARYLDSSNKTNPYQGVRVNNFGFIY